MIKLICDICKKEVDRRDVCDEDGHATKDAMIDIEIRDTYCRDYGGEYLICADCYNSIRDFINSRHAKWGFPKGENPKVEATLSEEQSEAKDINDMTTDDIIQWCKNHQP